MNSTVKTIMFWICILACLMVLITWVQKGATGKPAEIKYSDLFDKVQQGQVMDAEIQDRDLRGHLKATPKDEFHTTLPANYEDLDKAMLAAHVPFSIKEQQNNLPDGYTSKYDLSGWTQRPGGDPQGHPGSVGDRSR